jgi:hypothetical protein
MSTSAATRPGGTTGREETHRPDTDPAVSSDLLSPPSGTRAGETADDLHGPTVDLASRMTSAPGTDPDASSEPEPEPEAEPDPDTTAILELNPTVDLSAHLEQSQEDSPQRR